MISTDECVLASVLCSCSTCHIRKSENCYTNTAVQYTIKVEKGHSQCMLGSYKASPIVDLMMFENTSLLQITCLYNIPAVTMKNPLLDLYLTKYLVGLTVF